MSTVPSAKEVDDAEDFFQSLATASQHQMAQAASTTSNFNNGSNAIAEPLQEDQPGTRNSLDHTPSRRTPLISSKTSLVSEPTSGGQNRNAPSSNLQYQQNNQKNHQKPSALAASSITATAPSVSAMATEHRSPAATLGLAKVDEKAIAYQKLPEDLSKAEHKPVPFAATENLKFDMPKEKIEEITSIKFHDQLGPPFLPHQTRQEKLTWGPECFDKEHGVPFPPGFFEGRTNKTKPIWHDFFGPPIRKGGNGAQAPPKGSKPKSSQDMKPLAQSQQQLMAGATTRPNAVAAATGGAPLHQQHQHQHGAQQLLQQQTPQLAHMQQVQHAQQQQAMNQMLGLNNNNSQQQQQQQPGQQQFPPQVLEFAKYITIDIGKEQELLPLAAQCLNTPLPPIWRPVRDPNSGRTYFVNMETQQTTWDHPMKVEFVKKVEDERQKLAAAASKKTQPSADEGDKKNGDGDQKQQQKEYEAPNTNQHEDLDELLGKNDNTNNKSSNKKPVNKKPSDPKPSQSVTAASPKVIAKQNQSQQQESLPGARDLKSEPFNDSDDDNFFAPTTNNNNGSSENKKAPKPSAKHEEQTVAFDDL